MTLEFANQDGVAILRPAGELVGGRETEEFEKKIEELCLSGNTALVINLEKVSYMTTPSIGAIVKAYVSYTKRGAQMRMCGINGRIHKILIVTRLNLVFGDNCNQTEDEALASLKGSA